MKVPVALIHNPRLTHYPHDFLERPNPVYKAVEQIFQALGWDPHHAHTKDWNPLGTLIRPGDRVVIKPNLVASRDRERKLKGEVLAASSTHPAVLLPLVDYAWKALQGRGEITIVDTPVEGSNFPEMVDDLGLQSLVTILQKQKVNVKLYDLRIFQMVPKLVCDNRIWGNCSWNLGVLLRRRLPGDPQGYTVIDLKEQSAFEAPHLDLNRLRFHRSHPRNPLAHHQPGRHEYSIANTVLNADVFINVPKFKTHKKTGVTLSLKNLVGIVNQKYWLPHYRSGLPPGGDEAPYPSPLRARLLHQLSRYPFWRGHDLICHIKSLHKKIPMITEGSWSGNDTLWRVILDLNRILFFADRKGQLHRQRQRQYFTLIDGIIGGEGEGPIGPTPKKSGVLIAGLNPALVDLCAAQIMGFDYHKIKQITRTLPLFKTTPAELKATCQATKLNLHFLPPTGWENLIS